MKPVLTREKVGQIDARFSMAIEKYIKRDMITRIELDKDFIRDIGSIAQLGDLEFENDMCNVKELGYLKGKVESPALTCGQEKIAVWRRIQSIQLWVLSEAGREDKNRIHLSEKHS